MSKFESATFLIKNGYVKTRYFNGKFQVKITPKGKEAYLLLNRLKELSKWMKIYLNALGVKIYCKKKTF